MIAVTAFFYILSSPHQDWFCKLPWLWIHIAHVKKYQLTLSPHVSGTLFYLVSYSRITKLNRTFDEFPHGICGNHQINTSYTYGKFVLIQTNKGPLLIITINMNKLVPFYDCRGYCFLIIILLVLPLSSHIFEWFSVKDKHDWKIRRVVPGILLVTTLYMPAFNL